MPYTIKRFRNMKSIYGGAIYWQFLTTDMQVSVKPIFSIEPKGRSCEICKSLQDITSDPEVRHIFKIWTVQKPDNFRPGRHPFKNWKQNPIFSRFFFFKFLFCSFIWSKNLWHPICVQGPYLMRISDQKCGVFNFPKMQPNIARITALACQMGQIRKIKVFYFIKWYII